MNRTRLRAQLIAHEGLRLRAYRDTVGKLTIGVGRNLDDRGITQDEALQLLDNDINIAREDCVRLYGGFDTFSEERQHALIDFVFNVGVRTAETFRKMHAAIDARNWEKAAEHLLASKYAIQVGKRAQTIAAMLRQSC